MHAKQGRSPLFERQAVGSGGNTASTRSRFVIGVPDEYRGETVKVFVSLKPGISADASELIEFCKTRIAAYKYPRQLEIVDEVPKTVTGKFLRRVLRDRPVKD